LSDKAEVVLDDIADFCHQNGIKFACNPGGTTIKKGLKARENTIFKMNILILNKHEASDFTGIVEKTETKYDAPSDSVFNPYVEKMLITLKNYVKDAVVITDGKKGVYVYDGQKFYFSEPFPAKVVSTLGAGDAFASTFVGTLIKTGEIKKAISLALINSAAVVGEYGAQTGLKTYDELSEILAASEINIIEK
jgi:sugar/nucleoside kinase (ribokinase family)